MTIQITMFLRWVLTTSGFSLAGASFFFFLSFLIRAIGFLNVELACTIGERKRVQEQREELLPLESPGELPPDPADKQLHQLLVVHVEELVEVDTPVGELPEGPPLLQLDIGVSHDCFCKANTSQSS